MKIDFTALFCPIDDFYQSFEPRYHQRLLADGFKLHLVINEFGEMLAFQISPGNVDDRVPVPGMSSELFGKLYGDKGYISAKIARQLLGQGIEFTIRDNFFHKSGLSLQSLVR